MAEPVAVIDIGSGATKLLITGPEGLTDLNASLAHTGIKTKLIAGNERLISEAALQATATALDGFGLLIEQHGASKVAVVGTAAARKAANVKALAAVVAERTPTELQILSGGREAELSFAGAVGGRSMAGPVSVIDIGAGSTEFATRDQGGVLASWSLPIGGRTLTDQYLLSDPYRPEELSSALTVMELHLDDLRRELPALSEAIDDGPVIAVGAMTQIARVEIGSQDPDFQVDGEIIEKVGVEEVFRVLATESAEERGFNPGLDAIHVDDIVGAMCVLVEFMRQYGIADVLVSGRSLMHGLAAELLAEG